MSRHALVCLLVLTLGLTGCTRMIDSDKAEETIAAGTAERTGSKIRSVNCPGDQTAKQGETFTCSVVAADGKRGGVLATVTDDSGRVRLRVPFLNTRTTERSMERRLSRGRRRPVRVDCPDIITRRKGVVFTCATSTGTTRGRVRARQTDAKASVRYEVVRSR